MRYNLKNFVLLTLVLLFAFCNKPNNFSASYLKGKIDGIAFECNANITANKPEPIPGFGSDPTLIITGSWPMYSIKILILNKSPKVSVGTYEIEIDKQRSATIVWNGVDNYYAGSGGLILPQLFGNGRFTILEISDKYVKGIFEFATDVNSATGNLKTVSDGEFYIKRN